MDEQECECTMITGEKEYLDILIHYYQVLAKRHGLTCSSSEIQRIKAMYGYGTEQVVKESHEPISN